VDEAVPDSESPLLEWGVATRALEGQSESGDMAVVVPFDHGVLAAAVDGLGHGPEAARAARVAVDLMKDCAGESVMRLAELAHEQLKETRGAVMSLARFATPDNTLTWLGLGNVQGRLVRHKDSQKTTFESLPLVGSIVGYRLPPLRPVTLPVEPGDLLILATDGVRGNFEWTGNLAARPDAVARHILDREMTGIDDALVLVTRFLGAA